tara:strand:+ start:294 stop:890 length:597 start_codon:yes stop_codon:yes gene_type:complete
MKILNLYCGIGGNRKLWGENHEITAVEFDPEIAKIYQELFPNDKVIVGDAHQYLLDHMIEFDFIWSSPPCPTHSRFRNLWNNKDEYPKKYPNMMLYEEIILLKHFFKGKWVVENVISYYDPLIKPTKSQNHYFWSNFNIPIVPKISRSIRRGGIDKIKQQQERLGFNIDLKNYHTNFLNMIFNNCVSPELGKEILDGI